MKEYPIIFNDEMVQALMAGRKLQTRRPVEPTPPEWITSFGYTAFTPDRHISGRGIYKDQGPAEKFYRSRYGKKGDRLWVREAHKLGHDSHSGAVMYRADGYIRPGLGDFELHEYQRWMPSIHMMRDHSRFLLEVEDIHVERLQDITEDGAVAEGINYAPCDQTIMYRNYADDTWIEDWADLYGKAAILSYQSLWDKIYGKKTPWSMNPWVWVITFRRLYEGADVSTERKSASQGGHERPSV